MTQRWKQTLARAEAAALAEVDGEERWALTQELCALGRAEVITEAERLLQSEAWPLRDLGVSLLQQLVPEGDRLRSLDDPRISPLLAGALEDPEPQVVATAVHRTEHLNRVRELLGPRFGLVEHEDGRVREAMAAVLHGLEPDPRVLPALFALMQDPDAQVRNWATFCLGAQLDVDSDAVRQALRARLDDPDPEVVAEAKEGLERRAE